MKENKLYMARLQVVEAMEQGLPWHEAAKLAGLQISQSTPFRLRQRLRQGGEPALHDGRHGHSVKQGCYSIGANGTGKSVLIENMVAQDIAEGPGVCVLDPHGDLIRPCVKEDPH